jgi:ribosome-binding protein aMBF1 (putative translation factor)
MTVLLCSSSNCSHRHVSGTGISMKFRFSCGMALLVCPRCYWHIGAAAQESIDEAAKTEQVIERADQRRSQWRA